MTKYKSKSKDLNTVSYSHTQKLSAKKAASDPY